MIFLFFLALSGIFWLMMTLNETYEYEVRIPVEYVNVPKKIVLTSGETDSLRVTVVDKGIVLATYLYGNQISPIKVDFNRYMQGNGLGSVPLSDLKVMAAGKLASSTKISSVKPEKLVFNYNTGEKKRVPVLYTGKVQPSDFYYMANVVYQPDSVTIFASAEKLDSINVVYTEALELTDVHDTLMVETRLRKLTGVKMVPDEVSVTFFTDILTEVSIDNIPIVGINMPTGKVLRTFPAKTRVKFVTGANRYRKMSASDFEVVADYEEMMKNPSSKCRIKLTRLPDGITSVKLDTTMVDYLIEE